MKPHKTLPQLEPIFHKSFWLFVVILACVLTVLIVLSPWSNNDHNNVPMLPLEISTSVDYNKAKVLYTKIDSDCYYTTVETLTNLTKDTNQVWWISPWGGHFNVCYMMGGLTPGKTNISVLVYNAGNSTAQIHFGVEEDMDFIKGGGVVKFQSGFELAPNKYKLASFEINYPMDATQAFNFRLFFNKGDNLIPVYFDGSNTLNISPTMEEPSGTIN